MDSASYRSATIVVPILMRLFEPKSVIDVGCGVGTWLRAFTDNGVEDICGVDGKYAEDTGLQIPVQYFHAADLTLPYKSDRKYDLAVCLEVAEHLPSEAGSTLIQSLCDCADVVIFSAAIPHQGGTHHVNCRWQSFWASIFAERGFDCYDIVRPTIWGKDDVCFWYQQNLIVYIRASSPPAAGRVRAAVEALDIVHPQLYLSKTFDWPRIKARASKIPRRLTSIIQMHFGQRR